MFNSPTKDSNSINLKDGSCAMSESLHDTAHNAGVKVRGMIHSASDELSNVRDRVGTEIQSNPLRSGLIALGIGAIIGALLRK